MRFVPSYTLALCVLLLACNGCQQRQGAQSSSETATRPRTAAAKDAPTPSSGTEPSPSPRRSGPVIVTFGDSLTAGVAGRSYPEQLQDLLDQNGWKYRVENQGVSGDTTTDGLARVNNVISAHPALVVVEFGGNDGLRGIPIESTRQNLDEILSRLGSAKLPLVLLGITLPPNYGPEYVKPFTAMFPELAKKHHIPVMAFLLESVYRDSSLMQPDGVHPNGRGNALVARDVYRLIVPLLRRTSEK